MGAQDALEVLKAFEARRPGVLGGSGFLPDSVGRVGVAFQAGLEGVDMPGGLGDI